MIKFKAKVIVKMKPSIKDIKGLTLEHAIKTVMDVKNLTCHVGSVYYLDFEANNEIEALHTVEKLAQEILSNDVIETYEIRYLEEVDE